MKDDREKSNLATVKKKLVLPQLSLKSLQSPEITDRYTKKTDLKKKSRSLRAITKLQSKINHNFNVSFGRYLKQRTREHILSQSAKLDQQAADRS